MRVNLIINVEENRVDLVITLVSEGNSRTLIKWHREKTIQGAVGANRERNRMIEKILAKSQAEEVSERSLNAWARLTIPVHAQNQSLQVIGIIVSECDPDVRDHSGTRVVEKGQRLSRR